MVKQEYANAYKEVLDILKYVPKEDFEKIPNSKIETFSQFANYDYDFEYNPALELKDQNVSEIAQTIIAILFRDYWASKEQREIIMQWQREDTIKFEETKKQKFEYKEVFSSKENATETKEVVIYNTSFITKLKNWIIKILGKQ